MTEVERPALTLKWVGEGKEERVDTDDLADDIEDGIDNDNEERVERTDDVYGDDPMMM